MNRSQWNAMIAVRRVVNAVVTPVVSVVTGGQPPFALKMPPAYDLSADDLGVGLDQADPKPYAIFARGTYARYWGANGKVPAMPYACYDVAQDPSMPDLFHQTRRSAERFSSFHYLLQGKIQQQIDAFISYHTSAGVIVDGIWQGEIPPVVDIEIEGGLAKPRNATIAPLASAQWLAQIQQFLDAIEQACGVKPVIYSAAYILNGLGSPAWLSQYKLWLKYYPFNVYTDQVQVYPVSQIPAGCTADQIVAWQYNEEGRSLGFQFNDLNQITAAGILQYGAYGDPAPIPVVTPAPVPLPIPFPLTPPPAPSQPAYPDGLMFVLHDFQAPQPNNYLPRVARLNHGDPECVHLDNDSYCELDMAWQEYWFALMQLAAPSMPLPQLKKAWRSLLWWNRAFTNYQGFDKPGDARADFINGTDLTRPNPKIETIVCGGAVVHRISDRWIHQAWPIEVLDGSKRPPDPAVVNQFTTPWLVFYATISEPSTVDPADAIAWGGTPGGHPNGIFRVEGFPQLFGLPVPVPLISKTPNQIAVTRVVDLAYPITVMPKATVS